MIYITTGMAILMALVVFKLRMKETERPVNAKKIILPPLFMSTGFDVSFSDVSSNTF